MYDGVTHRVKGAKASRLHVNKGGGVTRRINGAMASLLGVNKGQWRHASD